jgi:hypothetical protein
MSSESGVDRPSNCNTKVRKPSDAEFLENLSFLCRREPHILPSY